ncbi:helix-hairpin-helix domain-containing protein [Propionibacteriaceae bacterium Y1700]|uniref:helix-hairpin-helix domain-containing protein n=1 Tax=Microlunatus sp. Y1700 TaxID=3418487 RepID=UPI003DA6DD81
MKEPMQQQLSEQLRERLARAIGASPADGPRRAGTGAGSATDESLIRTVLRVPEPEAGRTEQAAEVPAAIGAASDAGLLRLPFTRRHLVIVAVIATVAFVLAGWFLMQARAVPIDEAGAPEVEVSSAVPDPSVSSSAASPSRPQIKVHVTGAVRRPQVVTTAEGARVGEVIDAAGGMTKDAVIGHLNLAQQVRDGQQVFVSRSDDEPSEVRDPSSAGGSPGVPDSGNPTGSGAGGGQLDLNTATAAQLEALPGVGPVTAQSILAWREEHGRFSSVAELQEVDGIGPKTYAQLAPHLRV